MVKMNPDVYQKPETTKGEIGCVIFHIIIPLLVWCGISIYHHYYPKTKEELAQELDPNRKTYFEKFENNSFHPELKEKILKLDSVSKNLNEILYFVEFQKKNLENQNKDLEELIKQNKELAPIVESKKELVDAIFKVQEKRNLKEKRNDQLFGFIFGVLSSLFASILIFLWNKFIRRRKSNSS